MKTLMRKIDKKIAIPSEIKYIKKISQDILGNLKRLNIDKSVQFDVRLAVEEAVRNSIEHGNCYDKNLTINIAYTIDREKISIKVEDQGEGFDVKKIPDPRRGDNLTKEGGRGVFLIRQLMDRIEYSKKGNKVTMTKFFACPKA